MEKGVAPSVGKAVLTSAHFRRSVENDKGPNGVRSENPPKENHTCKALPL